MREATLSWRLRRLAAALLPGLWLGASPLLAQTVPAPLAVDAAALALSDVAFPVRRTVLEGVTVFEPVDLWRYATALQAGTGQALGAQSLADNLALIYREDGYPLAEVRWRADPGTASVVWTIEEGHVERVSLRGLDEATTARALRYLDPLTNRRPLRQADLERALALAGDLAGLSLMSRIVPLPDGGSELVVSGEAVQRRGGVVMDIIPLRPGHARRLHLQEERYGWWTAGDLVQVHATVTSESNDGESLVGGLRYRAPVGDQGDYVELLAGNSRAERGLTNTLDRSELRGRSTSLAWGHPFHRDLHGFGYWIAALDQASSVGVLGSSRPRSEASAARVYLVQGHTDSDQRLTQVALTLSAGSRPRAAVGDGERHFGHLRLGVGLSGPGRAGDSVLTYRFEAASQWTNDRLPRVERFVLGHYPYLRGYAPAEVDGDRGAAFTFELVRHGDVRNGLARIHPFVFVSAGTVASLPGPTSTSWTLASTGIGLRTTVGERWNVETWAGVPLRDGPQSRRGKAALYLSLGTSL